MKKKRTFYHAWRNADQRKIRVGYLSPFFCFHGMMQLSIVFLSNYDKERFEIFAYMYGKEDDVSGFLEGRVQGWRNITGCTADEAAKRIYEDRIDILVDISGNVEGRAIPVLERKPAPIQMAGIGYRESTRCSAVDYFLGDAFVDNDGTEKAFREELLILPQSHLCYAPACRSGAAVGAVPSGKTVIFAGIGSLAELREPVLFAWSGILGQVRDARLIFLAEDCGNKKLRGRVLRQMEAASIDLARVEVRDVPESFLVDFSDIDIVLDAGSRRNGSLFCDALYMGVPVVAWNGETHGERIGKGILENAGLDDLCADSGEEYVSRAVMLAKDRELLAALRQNLRNMMEKSPLMDEKGYMESLEQGYQMAWEQLISSRKPPSPQEAEHLVAVMDELIAAGDKEQVLAVAEKILAVIPQSTAMREKLFYIFWDEKGEAILERAIALFPEGSLYGTFLRAWSCYVQKRWARARRYCHTLIARNGMPFPWGGIEYWLLARIYDRLGDVPKAANLYRIASEKSGGNVDRKIVSYSSYLFTIQYMRQSSKVLYQESAHFRDFFEGVEKLVPCRRAPRKKLRIGYISPDFREHVVSCFTQAFFFAADKERFEVYGYARCKEDDISKKMQESADVWRYIAGCSHEKVARMIRQDEIDILVELAGHTPNNALSMMPLRPAPVQLCGIGYFATTGLSQVDYFIVDRYTAPSGEEQFFSEKLLRLPHSHFCYEQCLHDAKVEVDLPSGRNGFVTFGSMNGIKKVNDGVLRIWAEILERCPDAHLFLKSFALENSMMCRIMRKRMRKAGMDISRVMLEGPTKNYLEDYNRIDIALDTFPYPGGGTTCDALYMGVPVVTLAGNSHHERFGLSILSNIGLENLCAGTEEEYIDIAVGLARNRTYLKELHASLRGRMEQSPIMNQKLYMKDLEAAYEDIWKKYEAGL